MALYFQFQLNYHFLGEDCPYHLLALLFPF